MFWKGFLSSYILKTENNDSELSTRYLMNLLNKEYEHMHGKCIYYGKKIIYIYIYIDG